jgi:hypothetical protein
MVRYDQSTLCAMSLQFQKDPIEQWLQKKTKLMDRFRNLNECDFYFDYGRREDMVTKLHSKLGISRDQLRELLCAL